MAVDIAAPAARILLRSASFDRSFLPKCNTEQVVFDDHQVAVQHQLNRLDANASVHLIVLN